MQLSAGCSYKVNSATTTPVGDLSAQTLFTKGRITGVDANGNVTPERVPGFYLRDAVSEVPAGIHMYTTQVDSEWWCIDARLNKKQLPETKIFRLGSGQTVELAIGTKLILCEGSFTSEGTIVSAPTAVSVTTGVKQVVATSNCYGYLIDRERE